MKIRRPSFTAVDTFSRCGRQYAENVINGYGPPNKAMLRGTHFHNCQEEIAKHKLDHGCSWREAADAILEAPPEGVLSQPELESYVNRAYEVVKYLEPVPGGVEKWFDDVGRAWDLPVLPLCGKIDLLSSTVLLCSEQAYPYSSEEGNAVVDYKAISNDRRIKTSWEARKSMQLRIYCLHTGFTRGGFVYLLPAGEARAMFVEFTEEDLRIAHRWLTLQLDSMLACWCRFLGTEVSWGTEVELPESPDWTAWSLSHPDNILCSPKWCDHFDNCIGGNPA